MSEYETDEEDTGGEETETDDSSSWWIKGFHLKGILDISWTVWQQYCVDKKW